jgi:hypothetical protein
MVMESKTSDGLVKISMTLRLRRMLLGPQSMISLSVRGEPENFGEEF